MDYSAVGDTTNLAARLQQLAEPGMILVSEATRRLVDIVGAPDALALRRLGARLDSPLEGAEQGFEPDRTSRSRIAVRSER